MPPVYRRHEAKPGEYVPIEARLKDGTPITIRMPREDDAGRIARAFADLDQNTIYTRFFHHKKALTEAEMGRVTHPDMISRVFLFATILDQGRERIIGAADYAAFDDTDGAHTAEVAFLIEEDFQRRGVASLLFRELIAYARRYGVVRFVADVLPLNEGMLAVFARSGLRNERRLERGVVHVIMHPEPAATTPS
jgi:RimJ/RimL family protein N-acetyltransferase